MAESAFRVPRPRSSVPASDLKFGMISPGDTLLDADGSLTPVTFRFLAEMYKQVSEQQAQINSILTRLTAAGIP